MPWAELSQGPVEYTDTGGEGPVVVLLHGLPMTSPTQWRKVVPLLSGLRCILPTLPLGAHRRPMHPDADLTQVGVARLVGELLVDLDLDDVTLVLNDWGGAQFLLTERLPGAERVGRLMLVACEAFDNFPPGPARAAARLCRLPGGARLTLALLRTRVMRNQRSGYGGMSLQGIPDEIFDAWLEPSREPGVRRDFAKFATGTPNRRWLLEAADRLQHVDLPTTVVWAQQDRLMPLDHGRRLVRLLPRGSLVEVEDSSTLVPEDQPELLATLISELVLTPSTVTRRHATQDAADSTTEE